jgi:hypothetical protein
MDAKMPTVIFVEDASKDRRRVEVRKAELGDCTGDGDEGAGTPAKDEASVSHMKGEEVSRIAEEEGSGTTEWKETERGTRKTRETKVRKPQRTCFQ